MNGHPERGSEGKPKEARRQNRSELLAELRGSVDGVMNEQQLPKIGVIT